MEYGMTKEKNRGKHERQNDNGNGKKKTDNLVEKQRK
jgi:hypothetical protein